MLKSNKHRIWNNQIQSRSDDTERRTVRARNLDENDKMNKLLLMGKFIQTIR